MNMVQVANLETVGECPSNKCPEGLTDPKATKQTLRSNNDRFFLVIRSS